MKREPRIHSPSVSEVEIDGGFPAWYQAGTCCFSKAHPEVELALDDERRLEVAGQAAEES
ncbi:MAG: hypothetical protein DLM67_05245 [Candidatus Nephthysia bennettiae]|nr:MAG: hypothetical protein DLM67_05245 [Candidatus Dormibacteraeota bacterium]